MESLDHDGSGSKVETLLCSSEREVREGNKGSKDLQSGIKEVKALLSRTRLFNVPKLGNPNCALHQAKEERLFLAIDNFEREGNDISSGDDAYLQRIANICLINQHELGRDLGNH